MGAGKSTVGKKLARELGFKFVDLDVYVAERFGNTIEEIFDTKGEPEFRKLEESSLREVSQDENVVIATGGGTPCFFENLSHMQNTGLTVYLKLSPKSLYKRLIDSKIKRPLIMTRKERELRAYIDQLLESREHYYGQAQLIVKGEDLDVSELARRIKGQLK